MFSQRDQIQGYDDELLSAIDAEERRQEQHIIPHLNYKHFTKSRKSGRYGFFPLRG